MGHWSELGLRLNMAHHLGCSNIFLPRTDLQSQLSRELKQVFSLRHSTGPAVHGTSVDHASSHGITIFMLSLPRPSWCMLLTSSSNLYTGTLAAYLFFTV